MESQAKRIIAMHDFKIEKGVPIPSKSKSAIWYYLARDMEAGDSVVVNSFADKERMRIGLKTYGVRVTTRAEGDGTKYRVWCKEKPEAISG